MGGVGDEMRRARCRHGMSGPAEGGEIGGRKQGDGGEGGDASLRRACRRNHREPGEGEDQRGQRSAPSILWRGAIAHGAMRNVNVPLVVWLSTEVTRQATL